MVESFFDQAVEALILLEKPSDADAETGSIISILIVVVVGGVVVVGEHVATVQCLASTLFD